MKNTVPVSSWRTQNRGKKFGNSSLAVRPRHSKIGWFWTGRGMEIPLYLMLICLAILIRGGGPLSVDRTLGREI